LICYVPFQVATGQPSHTVNCAGNCCCLIRIGNCTIAISPSFIAGANCRHHCKLEHPQGMKVMSLVLAAGNQKAGASKGVCSTYLRSLYLRCDMSTNPKLFSSKSCYFFTKKCNIDSILCCVQIYEINFKISWQNSKIWCFKNKICRHIAP
jgi:hypothetical protein